MMSDYQSQYLPKAFHYYGMNKGKLGKGYIDGIPYGRISGPCDECGTPIISIQMNTSAKGMECTSEKVCPACGLIHQGAFTVLDRYEVQYTSKSYDTHEAWLIDAKQSEKALFDPNTECEILDEDSTNDMDYSDKTTKVITKKSKNRINWLIGRYDKQSTTEYNKAQYSFIVDGYRNELGMSKVQSNKVKEILNTNDNLFKMPYKIDDIIYALCIKEYTKNMNYRVKGGFMKQKLSTNRKLKAILKVIEDNT